MEGSTTGKKKKELLAEGGRIQPAVMIGKAGLSAGVIEDTIGQLKPGGLIKVKVLGKQGREEMEAMAGELAEKTGSELLQVKGRTFLLYK